MTEKAIRRIEKIFVRHILSKKQISRIYKNYKSIRKWQIMKLENGQVS